MAADVEFAIDRQPTHTVIEVSGYLDVSTSPRLREQIHALAEEGPKVLIIDLGPIEFIDSSALGVILNGWKLLHAEGATLAVVSPQPRITKVFEITAINLSIRLFPSMDEAVEQLTS